MIIREGGAETALNIIIKSKRLHKEIIKEAEKLLIDK
jgi:hypothetical protein